jgi:thiamine transport system permease protein
VELAIYQAFRFDFDLGKAALLASLQLVLAGTAALLALWVSKGQGGFGKGLDRVAQRWDGASRAVRISDFTCIVIAALFLLVPMVAVGARGLAALPDLPTNVGLCREIDSGRPFISDFGVRSEPVYCFDGCAVRMG